MLGRDTDRFLVNSSKYGWLFQKLAQLLPQKLKFRKNFWMSFPGFVKDLNFNYQFSNNRWSKTKLRRSLWWGRLGSKCWRFRWSMQLRWIWPRISSWRSWRRSLRRSPWRSLWRPLWWPRFLELSASRWGYFHILCILYNKAGIWEISKSSFLDPFIHSTLNMNFANFLKIAVPTKKSYLGWICEHSEIHPSYYFCDLFSLWRLRKFFGRKSALFLFYVLKDPPHSYDHFHVKIMVVGGCCVGGNNEKLIKKT